MGRALGEAELSVQEVEEARVAQFEPQPAAVEVGERDEEVGHGSVLATEEIGEAGGEIACVRHEATVARLFLASPNARIRDGTQELERGSSNPPIAGASRRRPLSEAIEAFLKAALRAARSSEEARQAVTEGEMGALSSVVSRSRHGDTRARGRLPGAPFFESRILRMCLAASLAATAALPRPGLPRAKQTGAQ